MRDRLLADYGHTGALFSVSRDEDLLGGVEETKEGLYPSACALRADRGDNQVEARQDDNRAQVSRRRGVLAGSSDRSKLEVRSGALTLSYCLATIAACVYLTIPASAQSPLPGEYPYHPFHSPFPSQAAAAGDEYRDKYLLGGWFGYRSRLAERGIKPTLLFIVDPFGNAIGGLRRGAAITICFASIWLSTPTNSWRFQAASFTLVSR